jgi:outer membrane autotransporter protein
VQPYARAEWIHEFDNDARTVGATYVFDPNSTPLLARTNEPDRDYGLLGLGVSAVLPKGYQAFLDYQGLVGFRDLSSHRFLAGLRMEF